jgi:hypothetical protein
LFNQLSITGGFKVWNIYLEAGALLKEALTIHINRALGAFLFHTTPDHQRSKGYDLKKWKAYKGIVFLHKKRSMGVKFHARRICDLVGQVKQLP